jgi:phenylacetate-CoA ligase
MYQRKKRKTHLETCAVDFNKPLFKYFVYYPVVWIRGQRVPTHIRRLKETQHLPKDRLIALQRAKLISLLRSAGRSVPFYMRSLQGKIKDGVGSLGELEKAPFVTKAQIKAAPSDFLSQDRFSFVTKKTTGGSTGQPLTIYKSRQAMAWELAAMWRGYSWAGVHIGDKQARFWGVPLTARDRLRARLIDFIANRKRCSAFSFGREDMERYTRELSGFKPSYFYGYVSMLEEYAKFFETKGEKPPFNLKCVISTSEVLTEYHRKLFERVFSAKVFNEYGCGEVGSIAHECERGSMHVMAENMIVEILDGDKPCEPGKVGEIVVTELNNHLMPLIRYRTGDYAAFSTKACECGRTLPVITDLFGRAYDTMRNREGKLFHGEFMMYIFEEAQRRDLGVNAFQVIQKDLQTFKVRVVPGVSYGPATEEFISNKVRERFDHEAVIEFEKVDKIDRAASGKMRLIVGMGGNQS